MLRICPSRFRAIASAVALLTAACSKSSPPPPEVTPTGSETINGTERLGWTQRAADAVELASVRYAIYVDGVRSELAGASCAAAAATADGFACSARLPTLTAGAHTLELASFVTDSSLLESARSAALRVSVVTQVESAVKTGAEPLGSKSSDITNRRISLADGTGLVVDLVAGGLNRPADLAFIPDGLLIAQRDGTVRSVRDGRLSEPAALSDRWPTGDRLLAIAIDPDFARTRFVFAVVAGGGTFTVIRVREVGGTFGDRVILLGGISAAAVEPVASLRFGPDARLYAAFDDGGDSRQVGDAASPNGKILRLNADGTTPDDQAGASPIYAAGSSSPAGLDWQPGTDVLWVADAAQAGITPVTIESTGGGKRIRGVARASWRLPAAWVPTAMAFTPGASAPALAGNLFVGSGTGQGLLRVRFDPLDRSRVAATEPLLQDGAGPLVAIAAGPDGAIYFATADSVWRLVPSRTR